MHHTACNIQLMREQKSGDSSDEVPTRVLEASVASAATIVARACTASWMWAVAAARASAEENSRPRRVTGLGSDDDGP